MYVYVGCLDIFLSYVFNCVLDTNSSNHKNLRKIFKRKMQGKIKLLKKIVLEVNYKFKLKEINQIRI